MSSPKILAFPKGLPAKPQYGEQLRLRIVRGKPHKAAYCLLANSILIGREDICDIVIDDPQASRRHVNLVWSTDHYSAQDLGSVNGFLINGKRVKQAKLEPGDVLTIGDTDIEVVAVGRVQAVRSKTLSKEQKAQREKNKKNRMLIIGAILFILYNVFFSENQQIKTLRESVTYSFVEMPVQRPRLKKEEAEALLNQVLPNYTPVTEQEKSAESFFKTGQREYRARNFRRAISAFETALTIDGDHERAGIYLKLARRDLEEEIRDNYSSAERSYKAFRYEETRMYLHNIMKILAAEPDHPYYEKANELLGHLDKIEGKVVEE